MARKSFVQLAQSAGALPLAKVTIPAPLSKEHKRSYSIKGIGAQEAREMEHATPTQLAVGLLERRGDTLVKVSESDGVKAEVPCKASDALSDVREYLGIDTPKPDAKPDDAKPDVNAAMERAKGALPNGSKVPAGK